MNENGHGEKAQGPGPDAQAIAASVLDVPRATAPGGLYVGGAFSYDLLSLARAGDIITPWGRDTLTRDRELREFWVREPYISSVVSLIAARNAAFSWTLEGGPRQTKHDQDLLQYANFGQGWQAFASRLTIDALTQDNGAFIETVRSPDSPEGVVIAINNLDARRCVRTGDPRAPFVYIDAKGKQHLRQWWQGFTFEEMPLNVESVNGLQLCAVSRALVMAQIVRDTQEYQQDKLGGRRPQEIHIIQGVTRVEIDDALRKLHAQADNAGNRRYMDPLMVGAVQPDRPVSVASVPFVSLPAHYDAAEQFKEYITLLAAAFLTDYQEIAPLPGGNLGTSQQSQILHEKSRGKGPGLWMKLIETRMNFYGITQSTFRFDEQDLGADEDVARIKGMRATRHQVYVNAGIYTPEVARQIMQDEGDLDEAYLELLQETDVTDDTVVEDTEPQDAEAERIAAADVAGNMGEGGGQAPPGVVPGGKARRAPSPAQSRAETRMRNALRKSLRKVGQQAARKVGAKDLGYASDDGEVIVRLPSSNEALTEAVEAMRGAVSGVHEASKASEGQVVSALAVLGQKLDGMSQRLARPTPAPVVNVPAPRPVRKEIVRDPETGLILRVIETPEEAMT